MSRLAALAYDYQDTTEACDTEKSPNAWRILLIEDNKSDILLTKKMLHDSSCSNRFEFTDVPRLVDALDLCKRQIYDLILLDLQLLDMDGISAVIAVRNQAPKTTMIVHSGSSDPNLKQEVLLCGAKHFLVKGRESPFSFQFMIQQSLNQISA